MQQMVEFWSSKKVYDQETISLLKGEMIGGPQSTPFPGVSKDLSSASAESGSGKLLFFSQNVSWLDKSVNFFSRDSWIMFISL